MPLLNRYQKANSPELNEEISLVMEMLRLAKEGKIGSVFADQGRYYIDGEDGLIRVTIDDMRRIIKAHANAELEKTTSKKGVARESKGVQFRKVRESA